MYIKFYKPNNYIYNNRSDIILDLKFIIIEIFK